VSKPVWTRSHIDGRSVIWDVSCPRTTLCVAGDVTGSILTGSTRPRAAVASFRPAPPKRLASTLARSGREHRAASPRDTERGRSRHSDYVDGAALSDWRQGKMGYEPLSERSWRGA
jgi:hypothetical protein